MMNKMTRREFTATSALAAGSVIVSVGAANAKEHDTSKILNYNPNMEYRRLGKTNLMVSAVCLGGHWKRVNLSIGKPDMNATGYHSTDMENLHDPDFQKNRHDVISECIEMGMNYVDACTGEEVLAYSKALKGRRDKFYMGYSWYQKESRKLDWRTPDKLIEGLDDSLKQTGEEYFDLWRITMPAQGVTNVGELTTVEEGAMGALELAKKQGKIRFAGISSHNRTWLASMVNRYDVLDVIVTPYTANTKVVPKHSLFHALQKRDVGMFGIKPFADNSLFIGDSAPNGAHAEEDDRRARLAIRYILNNPALTAPIPGLANLHQIENVCKAVQERRELDAKEKAELEEYGKHMWANLNPGYQWLRDWEWV